MPGTAQGSGRGDRQRRPRTQAERSEAMRGRLVNATIASLAQDGFSKTSIGRIVRRAKVSNGATGHHFPTKADLLVAAAEELFERSRRQMLQALGQIPPDPDSFVLWVERIWSTLHSQPVMRAYLELNMAAQSDKRLARALRDLSQRSEAEFDRLLPSSAKSDRDGDVAAVFPLTRSLMLGMAIQYHCLGHDATEPYGQLRTWARLVEPRLSGMKRARPL